MFDRKLSLEVEHTEEAIWALEERIATETARAVRDIWVADLACYDQYLGFLREQCC